jgi:hypothetical protein
MKLLRILVLFTTPMLSAIALLAQARTVSTMIEKENRIAVMIEINQSVTISADALKQKFQRAGLNDKMKKGNGAYKGVILSEISKDRIDIYTKVEQGPNNTSVVYMAVSRGSDNFTSSSADSSINENVEVFLNSFVKDANNQFADVGISNQMKGENKSEKEYQKLLDEQRDLEKKKVKIDSRLDEIRDQLVSLKIEVDKKKAEVEDSKVRRTNANGQ